MSVLDTITLLLNLLDLITQLAKSEAILQTMEIPAQDSTTRTKV